MKRLFPIKCSPYSKNRKIISTSTTIRIFWIYRPRKAGFSTNATSLSWPISQCSSCITTGYFRTKPHPIIAQRISRVCCRCFNRSYIYIGPTIGSSIILRWIRARFISYALSSFPCRIVFGVCLVKTRPFRPEWGKPNGYKVIYF